MMVTPGPGIVGVALGLAILATEYAWADRWLAKAREKAHQARLKAQGLDPRVRRRRALLTATVVLTVVVAVVVYVLAYDWPAFAVAGWDWVQGLGGWVPELPGM
jgi:cytochrome c-type biogenesis protein CcmH/NrfG